jgi:serpin B
MVKIRSRPIRLTMKYFLAALFSVAILGTTAAEPIATSINSFGLDLHRRLAVEGGNLVISPWSIESALAMTYGGAGGQTRMEMQTVLRLPADKAAVHAGFANLAADLASLTAKSQESAKAVRKAGGSAMPLEIRTANRLFGDGRYAFETSFLNLTRKSYGAPLEIVNFRKAPDAARSRINNWVSSQTKDRIRDLIPAGSINRETRLVLTNAIYLKAAWAEKFREEADAPFFLNGSQPVKVPGLVLDKAFGYQKIPGGSAVTIPYDGGGLQFVLFVPNSRNGLAAMEKKLTPGILAAIAKAETRDIILHFPKFKLEPSAVQLADKLITMGMPTAFDQPVGSADFSGIAARKPDDYLAISKVIHKAFIAVDQHGTEAAAATAVVMMRKTAMAPPPQKQLEIRVDHPFAFAIQHKASGACLFLGRVTDPR